MEPHKLPRIDSQTFKNGVFAAKARQRRRSFLTNSMIADLTDVMMQRYFCSCECVYLAIKSYIVYAAKTAGKRMMTVFDIYTDMRTFFILFADDDAAYWACFLLSSIMLPYIVFWASSHNFEDATRAHTLFNRKSPRNCCEKLTRLYYCLVAMPVIGLCITAVQIVLWWFTEIFMGLFLQKTHLRYVRNMEQRENAKFAGNNIFTEPEEIQELFRSIPYIPSVNAARYLTIIELFFESIPQCMLQMYIYSSGTSSYFTFQDVVISVVASILNIAINAVSITNDAHSVGMNLFDYIVYFMGNRVEDMLSSLVPVSKVLISSRRHVCNLTGFSNLYQTDIPQKMTEMIMTQSVPKCLKTIVLPSLKTDVDAEKLSHIVRLIAKTRYKKNIHVTMLASAMRENMNLIVCDAFIEDSKPASTFQRKEACTCLENCQECLNICSCCSIKMGDFIFGEREYTIDEALHVSKKTKFCLGCRICTSRKRLRRAREDSQSERRDKMTATMEFLWPVMIDYRYATTFIVNKPLTGEMNQIPQTVANTILLYALVGDYGILLAIRNVLMEKFQLGDAMKILVDATFSAIVEGSVNNNQQPRKRWPDEDNIENDEMKDNIEENTEENTVGEDPERTYKTIPYGALNKKTFDYEIVLSQMLQPETV
jgi:hypothetical protein